MKETRVYLLRHAETATPHVFHGAESDVELGSRGIEQAEAAAQYLSCKGVTRTCSSAMRRALQTAEPISKSCNTSVEVIPLLHERKVGPLSGTCNQKKEGIWPDTLMEWKKGNIRYAPEGSESLACMQDRIFPVWNSLLERHSGETVAVVCHGMVIKVLLLGILPGWDVSRWDEFGPVPNIGITEMVFSEQQYKVIELNKVPS